jgi:hypothetical protein
MKLFIKILLCTFLVFIVLVCAGYYLVFHLIWQESRGEVSRVTSPDGKLDAVYVQSNAGAMASADLLVYIVPKGHETPKEKDQAVFHGKHTYDLEISWKADQELLIQYNKSDIRHFQSYFYPFSDSRYKVEIRYMEREK